IWKMASFGAKRKKSPKSQNIASDAVFKAVPDNEPLLTLLHLTRTLCYAIPHLSGCGGLVVRSRLRSQRAPGSKPDSIEDPPCMWAY
ncbi:hypothetical protein AVEN_151242-1, partial [Araneus ventricosus]